MVQHPLRPSIEYADYLPEAMKHNLGGNELATYRNLDVNDPLTANYHGFPEVQRAMLEYEPTAGVVQAAERLAGVMDITPLEYASGLSNELGVSVFLKREDTTPVHSFKVRGAYNKMAQLTEDERERGVLAASAGNHAQGVALSAQLLGLQATIVMPRTTHAIKVKAVSERGAEVVLHGDSYDDAYRYSQQLIDESGPVFIHPFDDEDVIAGQGTVAKEILDELPEVTHIFVPIGGGGLIAGVANYVKNTYPDIKVIGVQSEESMAMKLSIEKGERVTLDHVGIFAEGVAVKNVGALTFDMVREYVDDIISVTNDEITAGQAQFYNETRSVLEGAGALGIAGLQKYADAGLLAKNSVVSAICSGANMDFSKLGYVVERSEIGRGHEALFAIKLPEEPGALLRLCQTVVNGHGITEFKYRKRSDVEAHILVGFSMANLEDKHNFMDKLAGNAYDYVDLSKNDLAKEHLRHMVGGRGENVLNEVMYEIEFPERPGALTDFLESIGTQWNISLFNYRGLGGDTGRVLIGFEDADTAALERLMTKSMNSFARVSDEAASLFL